MVGVHPLQGTRIIGFPQLPAVPTVNYGISIKIIVSYFNHKPSLQI
jgi:hypothetical protein